MIDDSSKHSKALINFISHKFITYKEDSTLISIKRRAPTKGLEVLTGAFLLPTSATLLTAIGLAIISAIGLITAGSASLQALGSTKYLKNQTK